MPDDEVEMRSVKEFAVVVSQCNATAKPKGTGHAPSASGDNVNPFQPGSHSLAKTKARL